MNKEELIEFLKENLSIEIKEPDSGCSCCYGPPSVSVVLKLDGETISEDWFHLPECDHE